MGSVWGIIGGGFGLYGYLPALVLNKINSVLILEKNRSFIESRPELNEFIPYIEFVSTKELIFIKADSLIFAVPPAAQEGCVEEIINLRYKNLILEKPLARTPERAESVLNCAFNLAESVRVGYSFQGSYWAKNEFNSQKIQKSKKIRFKWLFTAHHFSANNKSWKAIHEMGGGALRFYGIQLIAYICELPDVNQITSQIFCDKKNGPYRWQARITLENDVEIEINLDSKKRTSIFEIETWSNDEGRIGGKYQNPFEGESQLKGLDSRVPIMADIIKSLQYSNDPYYIKYKKINKLWARIENSSKWIFE
jgi:predicted dehydrogenase